MTAITAPAVPLPDGATFADHWQGDVAEMAYRMIGSDERSITDDVAVYVSAVQLADGSIDVGRFDGPGVFVNSCRLPVERAHLMISALQEAIAQAERWAGPTVSVIPT